MSSTRRGFLGWLAALPLVGALAPKALAADPGGPSRTPAPVDGLTQYDGNLTKYDVSLIHVPYSHAPTDVVGTYHTEAPCVWEASIPYARGTPVGYIVDVPKTKRAGTHAP